MKIAFLPIDNRPVCYNLPKDICAIDNDIELILPPREYLGDLKKEAKRALLFEWLQNIQNADALILSLDTLIYGGLISSRRSSDTLENLKKQLEILKNILLQKNTKIYAFSSIMRISNNNYNEEEKEYWSEYGKKIFEYSFKKHRGDNFSHDIPKKILDDYLTTRNRNFEINKILLSWQKEGLFDTLIFSKDDCAEFGLNVQEAQIIEQLGGKTKTGADEIPLTLLSRAISKNIKIFIKYTEPEYKNCISNYEDVSIEKSVLGQLELGGFEVAENEEKADIILLVNNFIKKQGELVMGWNTQTLSKNIDFPQKPYCVADVRFANGADNIFVQQLLENISLQNFYGYAGWNTSANTLGTILATVKIKWNAVKYNADAFNRLQMIRFLDDWAYQANVRSKIEKPCEIKHLMNFYENKLTGIFKYNSDNFRYSYPWNRKFEVEISS